MSCLILFFNSHPVPSTSLKPCTNCCSSASPSLCLPGVHGHYDKHRCWWGWSRNCAKCCLWVKPMDGIFCAIFCESQRRLPACWKTWQARCYKCLGKGKFPLKMTTDEEGNLWFWQEHREQRISQGVRGAHASIPFQCEDCWLLNLKGQLPVPELDDMYVMCIHQANLDAMGGRAILTIEGHAAAVKQTVQNLRLIRKMPTILHRGPIPLADNLGMSMAVDMLYKSLSAKPH
jgi:hypothetical protein